MAYVFHFWMGMKDIGSGSGWELGWDFVRREATRNGGVVTEARRDDWGCAVTADGYGGSPLWSVLLMEILTHSDPYPFVKRTKP
jgi:hypothetical protein